MPQNKISRQTRAGLRARARKMRAEPTQAEARLWESLRKRQLGGFRFRRQNQIGAYIVDFFCPERKLVIEVDGPIHKDTAKYDQVRDEYLSACGCTVLRFKNEEVMGDLEAVKGKILKTLSD